MSNGQFTPHTCLPTASNAKVVMHMFSLVVTAGDAFLQYEVGCESTGAPRKLKSALKAF